jgi:hypothetical protein
MWINRSIPKSSSNYDLLGTRQLSPSPGVEELLPGGWRDFACHLPSDPADFETRFSRSGFHDLFPRIPSRPLAQDPSYFSAPPIPDGLAWPIKNKPLHTHNSPSGISV